jgi:LemA protein
MIAASHSLKRENTMAKLFGHRFALIIAALATLLLGGCGYNDLQRQDEQIKAAWSEVLNQYQRRADLVPNLVNTVKGYAAQEERVLTEVTNARAQVGSIKATPELINDPQAFAKFTAAQAQLQSSLSRLLLVAENYPQLKSDQNFRDLQSQLEGTENRIAVERMRYNEDAQAFNTARQTFPTVIYANFFGSRFAPKAYFQAQPGAQNAPKVTF